MSAPMMRRVDLIYDDDPLFNTELSQPQYDFFQKHEAAFRRMCEEQSKDFWIRYIMTFRSFTNKYGYLKDFPHKKQLTYILDFAFILIHEKFVDAKFKDTKTFISDIVTIARHRSLATYCETRKCMNGPRSKNPFFAIETRDVFRRLFGSQNDEQSYLKALILIPLFLRFGGSVMICLRRWLEAPPMNPEDKYWKPDPTPKDKSSKKKHRPTHCFEAVESAEDDLRRGASPQDGKADTEDVLRFVEGDEATNAFVSQQKRDKKKKKRGKSKDALPLAEIGDLVALVVTVHKDGQIKYSGVKMESKPVTDGATVTELPAEEEEATYPGRREETTTRHQEILNSLHDLAQTADKDALEKIMLRNIEMAALDAHEQRKRDEDARKRAERKRRDEEREKEALEKLMMRNFEMAALDAHEQRKRDEDAAERKRRDEERAKKEAEERAKKEAEERVKKEAEERAKKEAEERVKKEAEERAKKEAASVNGVSKTKSSKKKRSGQSGGAANQNKSVQDKPLEPVVRNGVADGGGLLNGDVKHKVKLRQCANCKQTEASLKLFKKCQKCKIQKVTEASYYCSKECQAVDWEAVHKAFHKTYVQL